MEDVGEFFRGLNGKTRGFRMTTPVKGFGYLANIELQGPQTDYPLVIPEVVDEYCAEIGH